MQTEEKERFGNEITKVDSPQQMKKIQFKGTYCKD